MALKITKLKTRRVAFDLIYGFNQSEFNLHRCDINPYVATLSGQASFGEYTSFRFRAKKNKDIEIEFQLPFGEVDVAKIEDVKFDLIFRQHMEHRHCEKLGLPIGYFSSVSVTLRELLELLEPTRTPSFGMWDRWRYPIRELFDVTMSEYIMKCSNTLLTDPAIVNEFFKEEDLFFDWEPFSET